MENEDYWLSEKSDGVRYLLYSAISAQQRAVTYLVNRKFEFIEIPLSLVTSQGAYHRESLLDGEFVLDREEADGIESRFPSDFLSSKCCKLKDQWYSKHFLLFDAVVVNGRNIRTRPLNDRLQHLQNEVMKPRDILKRKKPEAVGCEPFTMKMKQMFKTYHLRHMFEVVIPGLKHDNDGLIFTPVHMCYIPGQWKKLLKWKPGNLNTIDFMIESFWEKSNPAMNFMQGEGGTDPKVLQFRLLAGTGGVHGFYDWLTLDEDQYEKFRKMKKINGRIVECVHDPEWYTVNPETGAKFKGGWKVLRFRDDRSMANDVNTIKRILFSVNDNVTSEDLIKHQDKIHQNWKDRENGILPPAKDTFKGKFRGKNKTLILNANSQTRSQKRGSELLESPIQQEEKRPSFGSLGENLPSS